MNRQLFELQEADNLLVRLRRELSHLNDGTHARGERDTLQKALDEQNALLNALNTRRGASEDELKTAETKLARQNARLMNAQSAHEVTALQRDIAALTHARGDLDEAVLTLMDEAETATARLQTLEAELSSAKKRAFETESAFARDSSRLEAELAEAVGTRQELASQIEPAAIQKYDSIAKRHGGIAVVHVEDGHCSGCGNQLTPFNLREAKSQDWPSCESCNRLLWIE